MRRLFTIITTALVTCLLSVPAIAHAAPMPLGSGTGLFNPAGTTSQQCTAAFAATDGVNGYLIAGPTCTGGTLYSSVNGTNVLVGTVVSKPVPYNGFAIVQVTNTTDWELVSWVPDGKNKIVLTGSKETPVGGKVCHASATFSLRCGTADAVDQTVTFPWGKATGVTRTSICSGSRDLGAAIITDDQAQGVPLGGLSEICTTPGASYFVPINPILEKFGLKLITG
jgi:streptogrisin C